MPTSIYFAFGSFFVAIIASVVRHMVIKKFKSYTAAVWNVRLENVADVLRGTKEQDELSTEEKGIIANTLIAVLAGGDVATSLRLYIEAIDEKPGRLSAYAGYLGVATNFFLGMALGFTIVSVAMTVINYITVHTG